MTAVFFPEFHDAYEPTNYPFADASTLANSSGQIILPGTFLGASLYPVGGQVGLYLSTVVVNFQNCILTIGDSTTATLASVSFDLFDPPDTLALTDTYGRPAGVLVSTPTSLALFQAWGSGTYTFTPAQTQFCAGVCFPTPAVGVQGILLEDGTLFTDDVWLVGEDGIVLTPATVVVPGTCGNSSVTYAVIRVDIVGDPLFRRRLCVPVNLFQTPSYVKQIQFQKGSYSFLAIPDAQGNIRIGVSNASADDTVLRVQSGVEGVKFEMAGQQITGG